MNLSTNLPARPAPVPGPVLSAAELKRRAEARDLAQHWLGLGGQLIPMRPKSKIILFGFGLTQRKLSTLNQALYRIQQGANLGLVLGGPGRFACLDFESTELYEQWRLTHGRDISTWTERSARGVHVFFQAVGPEPLKHCSVPHQVDFLTSGVVTLAPSIHQTGFQYAILERHPIASISLAQQPDVVPFTPTVPDRPQDTLKGDGERARRPIRGLNLRELAQEIRRHRRVSDEAIRIGVEALTNRNADLDKWKGRCPFHDGDDPDSLWLDDKSGLWGCASTNCRAHLETGAHDVITMRAFADQMSLRLAIESLARDLGLLAETRRHA